MTTLLLAASACTALKPWRNEPVADEVNLVFTLQNNLLFLGPLTVDGKPCRCFFSSAAARSALDPRFQQSLGAGPDYTLQLDEKQSLRIRPALLDLHGIGDGLIGADAWGNTAITVDYHAGLITYQKYGIRSDGMAIFHFSNAPTATVSVDGHDVTAIVDTASPDTLTLPRDTPGRGNAHVVLAGADLGTIDVHYADVPEPRLGNRVLAHFLVTIDYGHHEVGLWRDPRSS